MILASLHACVREREGAKLHPRQPARAAAAVDQTRNDTLLNTQCIAEGSAKVAVNRSTVRTLAAAGVT